MTNRLPDWLPEALLIFAIVFGPLAFGAVEPWSVATLEIDVFLLLFVSSLRGRVERRNLILKTILPAFIAILLIGMMQGARFDPAAKPSFLPFTSSAFATSHALLLWSAFAALIWCAPQVLNRPGALYRICWIIFILGAVIALVGIAQRGQGNQAYYGLRPIRHGNPFGPYTNYDHAACMMSMSALMGLGLFLSRLYSLRANRNVGPVADLVATQTLMAFLLAVILVGIWSTGSRGGLLALVTGSWVTAALSSEFMTDPFRRRLSQVALLLMLLAIGFWLFEHPRWLGLISGSLNPDDSTAYRLSMYRSGLRMWRDFPIFGVGLGSVASVFPRYQEALIAGFVDHLHNDWLELLVECGFSGFVIVFGSFLVFSVRALSAWFKHPSRRARCLLAGAISASVAFLIQGLVDFNFHIPANAVLFIAVLSILGAGNCLEPGSSRAPEQREPQRALLRYSFAALAVGLIVQAARPAVAESLDSRARGEAPERRVALEKQAYAWDPSPQYSYAASFDLLQLADSDDHHRNELLRESLRYSTMTLRQDPLNPNNARLQNFILWRISTVHEVLKEVRKPAGNGSRLGRA